ncbi:MAG: flagellar hook-length control protein FliK [Steroidobacteraceae bacterium]
MVTASVDNIGAMIGQGGVTQRVAGNRASADGDATEFAQLLDGMDGEDSSATAVTVAGATPGRAGQTHVQADNAAVTSAADQAALSAGMLALCGAAAVPTPAPTPVPALIATASAADESGVDLSGMEATMAASIPLIDQPLPSQAPAATIATDVQGQGSTDQPSANGNALTAFDLSWLHSNIKATSSQIESSPIQSNPIPLSQADAIELPDLLKGSNASPEQQGDIQKLLVQANPMIAMLGANLHRERVAADATDTAQSGAQIDAMNALGTTQLQPTQLAGDVNVIDAMPRHVLHGQVGSHQWATELGHKLTLLASKDTQSATLYMTPADLGPVQVRIDLHQDQASVWFTAEHADTRSALEQSLPRLRELFTAQGMSLTDAGVFGDRSRQQADARPTANQFASSKYAGDDSMEDTSMVRTISLGLLDAYA